MIDEELTELFLAANCTGTVSAVALDGSGEAGFGADEPMVAGSVIKICVALEAERQFADGRLDPARRVRLTAADRTPGTVGFSLFQDDIEVSLRDLVAPMLTISDNVATDALVRAAGLDSINASLRKLGLTETVMTGDIRTVIDRIGQDAGFAGWDDLTRWRPPSDAENAAATTRMRQGRELRPATATRTTAREMTTLLRLIWTDQAGPAAACRRVRELMAKQLTKNRLASGFPYPATVSAKSGGLAGTVRNEAGVVEFPDGRTYAVAVFTRTERDGMETPMNHAIGQAAALAVASIS
ncbi:serine hydrolase [Fodinicola acaciae]|uniref:serine hydrolase n=1 Tax=Fodinicola acaciae TaxID=2681555 RepID=UPI0013D4F5B1|nr:serine hydrolase [Fodinicola acaciae]